MWFAAVLVPLLLGALVLGAPAPSRLDDDETRSFWKGWLLLDDPSLSPEDGGRKKGQITPKSVFIAPVIKDLPDCAPGYRADALGRCHRLVKIDQSAQLSFLLQKLNAMYAKNDKFIKKSPQATTEGPLQVAIPLFGSVQTTPTAPSTTSAPVVTTEPPLVTTQAPVTEEVEIVVVAAQVEVKDEENSTSIPGAIVTLWHLNNTSNVSASSANISSSEASSGLANISASESSISSANVSASEGSSNEGSSGSEESSSPESTTETSTQDDSTVSTLSTEQEILSTLSAEQEMDQENISTLSTEQEVTSTLNTESTETTLQTDEETSSSETETTTEETNFSEVTETIPPSPPKIFSLSPIIPPRSTPHPSESPLLQVHKQESDIRVVESEDLSSDTSQDVALTLPGTEVTAPGHDLSGQRLRWPETSELDSGWSWGPWPTTQRPVYLNFWSSLPSQPEPTRATLRRPQSRYPTSFNRRPGPFFYRELSGQDVASVFRQQPWRQG